MLHSGEVVSAAVVHLAVAEALVAVARLVEAHEVSVVELADRSTLENHIARPVMVLDGENQAIAIGNHIVHRAVLDGCLDGQQ